MISEIHPAAATERVSWGARVLLSWAILQLVLSGTWHVLLLVLIDGVSFPVKANLGSLNNLGGDCVLSCAGYLFLTFLDHTWTLLCTDTPASSL